MTMARWVGSLVVLGLALLMGAWLRRRQRPRDIGTVTPQWINEHAYERNPRAHSDQDSL